ncbi:MAG: hypothetical protein M9895_00280 [Aquamicrobium sp.]|uniref:hypothetical protein n=1 Tax=Aquamicrobium sp. TaxID=1872579 RepID=UPI00349E8E80|nr:hypothetical protein [Aquamicrobium sp.]
MTKLTPARRRALEWYRDNDGAKYHPVAFSRRTVQSLIDEGFLREERPTFGFARHYMADAGRTALDTIEARP